jgi:hypothetical protein
MHPDIDQQTRIGQRLRALPPPAERPYDWAEFRFRGERLVRARQDSAQMAPAVGAREVAIAAALLAVICGLALWSRIGRDAGTAANRSTALALSAQPKPAAAAPGMLSESDARALAAERVLASLPPEPVIVRFGTRVAVVRLEDRIAQLDDLLTAATLEDWKPARVTALQQERGRLVTSLAQVRYAETLAAESP